MEAKAAVNIETEGDVAIASFRGTCVSDVEEITGASTLIREYIKRHQPSKMIFDFSGVKFFSSQVLGLLLEARAHLKACGGEVLISALSPQLERVFKITNLDKIFAFYPDKEAAVDRPVDAGS